MKIAQIQQRVTSAINQDPYKDRIKSVSLFGSFLHGDARPDSDIDLLFEMDQTKTFSLFQLIELQDRLGKKLGRAVDLVERDSLDKYIKDDVLAEAKTLYLASPAAAIKAKKGEIKIIATKKEERPSVTVLLSESALMRDWARPEEDEAWSYL